MPANGHMHRDARFSTHLPARVTRPPPIFVPTKRASDDLCQWMPRCVVNPSPLNLASVTFSVTKTSQCRRGATTVLALA
jgi:hypothetical protein